jgi:hypothetical protein
LLSATNALASDNSPIGLDAVEICLRREELLAIALADDEASTVDELYRRQAAQQVDKTPLRRAPPFFQPAVGYT